MKYKKIMLITLLLLTVFTIGAVSAADNVDALAVDDAGEEQIVEAPAEEVCVEVPVDDDVMGDEELTIDDFDYRMINNIGVDMYDSDSIIFAFKWPEKNNVSFDRAILEHEGNLVTKDPVSDVYDQGSTEIIKTNDDWVEVKLGDLGLKGFDSPEYWYGNYVIKFNCGSSTLLTFGLNITDTDYRLDIGDFHVNFINAPVDVDDRDAIIFSFIYHDVYERTVSGTPVVFAYDAGVAGDVYGDDYYDKFSFNKHDLPTGQVTLDDLRIYEPGDYRILVKYGKVIGKTTLKVTKTYTADDFISIADWEVTDPDDPVCMMEDSTKGGLNGIVTVYSDGNQVYSSNLIAKQYENVNILLRNLTSMSNGNHKIKVVYEKSDGKKYTKEETVSFAGISDEGNIPTKITASDMTITYGDNKNLVATLKDVNGKPIAGVDVYIDIMGVQYPITTDKDGKIKQSLSSLPPKKSHVVTFTFKNEKYAKSTKTVKVTVNKAAPKMTASAKTFKKSDKTKKYVVTLKTNKNAAMNKVKLSLKVNGKSYSATTNAKGQATFKLTKLTKKGSFTATVKYSGNSYYNAKTVKPKITVK